MFDEALTRVDDSITALADLAATDAGDGATLGDAIGRIDRQIRRLEATRLVLTRQHDQAMAWKADGHRTAGRWHRDHRQLTGGQANREVETARRLPVLPQTAAKVAAGDITVTQAAIATRAATGLAEDDVMALDALVAETAPEVDDRRLRDTVTEFVHRVAPDQLLDHERQAFERRSVAAGRAADGGVWINGRLDVIGGEALLTALSALSAPRGKDDDRTAGQRRSDALADLADRVLRGDATVPVEGGHRPAVSVTADLETLEGRTGSTAARLDHQGPVSGEAARQLACDANLHRVLTRGRSEILDVGRAHRTATSAQRRALAVRDGGCVGCGAPPGWADAHHIRYWTDGGPTDLANLVLLCRSCHTNVHHRRWTVHRTSDGAYRIRRPRRTGAASPGTSDPPTAGRSGTSGDPPRPTRKPDMQPSTQPAELTLAHA